jgi:AraC family transcriptional regulator of arabinose operon
MGPHAKDLRDTATPRLEAHTPEVRRLVAGQFTEGPGYAIYRSRGTTDWLLIHTVAGVGRFGSGPAAIYAQPGDTTLIPPHTEHDYGVEDVQRHWQLLFAHFHPRADWRPLLDWPQAGAGVTQIRSSGEITQRIAACLADAVRLSRSVLAQRELLAFNALEAALLWCDTQNPRAHRVDERILAAVEYVERHLADELTIQDLARASALSVSRFAHLFRAQLKMSPQRFIETQRMSAATQLLEHTRRPVAWVAAEVGYPDPLYFSTRFRRRAGLSPTAYRQRSRPARPE